MKIKKSFSKKDYFLFGLMTLPLSLFFHSALGNVPFFQADTTLTSAQQADYFSKISKMSAQENSHDFLLLDQLAKKIDRSNKIYYQLGC